MSGGEAAEQATEEAVDEPQGMSERTARVVLLVVACGAMWGVVSVFPWIAYIAVGVGLTLGWQRVRSWQERRGGVSEDAVFVVEPDVVEALRRLIGDDKGVLLTRLQKDLGLPDTKAVKALLEAEGIPWKASRTREGNGPAVRKEAIPAASSPVAADAHGEGCCCRSGGNDNGNNTGGEGPGEGLHVEAIGQAGHVVRHPADAVRHHKVRSRWGHSGNGAS